VVTEVGAAPSRSPVKFLVVALGIVLLLGAAAVVVTTLTGGGYKVRYEVDTVSGSADQIVWTGEDGEMEHTGVASPDKRVRTPWSTEVTFEDTSHFVSIALDSKDGGATCRIFVNGDKRSEFSSAQGAMCEVDLAQLGD
jgi:hypothetical protein